MWLIVPQQLCLWGHFFPVLYHAQCCSLLWLSFLSAGDSQIYTYQDSILEVQGQRNNWPHDTWIWDVFKQSWINISKTEPIISYYHWTPLLQQAHVLPFTLPLPTSWHYSCLWLKPETWVHCEFSPPASQPIIKSFCIYYPLLLTNHPKTVA